MSEHADEIAAIRKEFAEQMGELRGAVADLSKAKTPEEKQEARADVREAEADLKTLASKHGISESAMREAVDAAKKQERLSELRPLVAEIIAEIDSEDDDEEDGDDKTDDDDAKGKGAKDDTTDDDAGEGKKPPPVEKDTEPVQPHWAERSVGELLR